MRTRNTFLPLIALALGALTAPAIAAPKKPPAPKGPAGPIVFEPIVCGKECVEWTYTIEPCASTIDGHIEFCENWQCSKEEDPCDKEILSAREAQDGDGLMSIPPTGALFSQTPK